jgi:Flp pilus assembly secretin CpaC
MLGRSLLFSMACLTPGLAVLSANQYAAGPATPQQVEVEVLVAQLRRAKIPYARIQIPEALPDGRTSFSALVRDRKAFVGFLNAAAASGAAKILAEPCICTVSGKAKGIVEQINRKSRARFPLLHASHIFPVRIAITVLPTILDNGKIQLEIEAEISKLVDSVVLGPPEAGWDIRSVRYDMRLHPCQTMVFESPGRQITSTKKVPFLGDLPFVGTLFLPATHTETEDELLVVVTPQVLSAFR